MHTNIMKANYMRLILYLYKNKLQLKNKKKLAVKFWYSKMLYKSFESWVYFFRFKQYKADINMRAKFFFELKLLKKVLSAFEEHKKFKAELNKNAQYYINLLRNNKYHYVLNKLRAHANVQATYNKALEVLCEIVKNVISRKSIRKFKSKIMKLKADNLYKEKSKRKLWIILKQYQRNSRNKVHGRLIRKTFKGLLMYVTNHKQVREQILLSMAYYNKSLKRKCCYFFKQLLIRLNQSRQKEEVLKKNHELKVLRQVLDSWAKCKVKASDSRNVENIRKRIYWNKLLEYVKSQQIKKIQREFIVNTSKNLFIKKHFRRWVNKYKAFRRIQLKYRTAIRFFYTHLVKKTVLSLQLYALRKQYYKNNLQKAINHWAKLKYKDCLVHLKLYVNKQLKKKEELKQAMEDHKKVLKKNAICKWLQVGFYWLNKKIGADCLLQKEQKTYCSVLKYALFWRNKTLSVGKLNAQLHNQPLLKVEKHIGDKGKKEWELMQWLHNITNTKVDSKAKRSSSKSTQTIAKRIHEIEKEIQTFNEMKDRLRELRKRGDSEEVEELKKEVMRHYPRIKSLLAEIRSLKQTV